MEHAVGTKITLEVAEVENDRCDGCYFHNFTRSGCDKPKTWDCYARSRTDAKNIIYKLKNEESK